MVEICCVCVYHRFTHPQIIDKTFYFQLDMGGIHIEGGSPDHTKALANNGSGWAIHDARQITPANHLRVQRF